MLDFRNKTGFTIIEVVLVLAIAGLIFLMVFVALPSLQRSQRDTQRRQDVSKVASAVTNWLANGNSFSGNVSPCFPSNSNPDYRNIEGKACDLLMNYLNPGISSLDDDTFKDPEGERYNVGMSSNSWGGAMNKMSNSYAEFGTYAIVITFGAKCNPSGIAPNTTGNQITGIEKVSDGNNYFAVRYRLEDGGIYCVDNQ